MLPADGDLDESLQRVARRIARMQPVRLQKLVDLEEQSRVEQSRGGGERCVELRQSYQRRVGQRRGRATRAVRERVGPLRVTAREPRIRVAGKSEQLRARAGVR